MDPTAIGPGIGAFFAFFFLALALFLILRNMNARMRRMAYRERDRLARMEAELAAEEAGPDGAADASSTDSGNGSSPPSR